jgi:hypothetical protein
MTQMAIQKSITYWLRWLAVLPGAVLAGAFALFPLHWVLYNTLSNFIEPYPQLPERLLTPAVVSGVFVWAGSEIAPEYKTEAAALLFGVWMFAIGGFTFLTLSGGSWSGQRLVFQGGGIGVAMAIIGGLVGLFYVRNDLKRQERHEHGSDI